MEKEKEVLKSEEENKYPHKSLQLVEDTRKEFLKSYKLHNTLKLVITAVCLVAIIVAFILMPNLTNLTPSMRTGLTITIAIIALGGTYGYSLYVRKKFERKMKVYFELYFNCINEYVFGEKYYSEVELQKPGKITLDEFNECKLYKDVIETGSRGLTTFKYGEYEVSVVDCAGNIKADKRMKPVFVGKMVRAKCAYKGEHPIFVYLKGNDRALPPTNLEGIKNVFEDQKMVVYSNSKVWNKTVGAAVTKALLAIKTNKILVDVAISMYEGKLFIMMGYDDPLMVLPLQQEFDYKPSENYKKDMHAICKLIEVLNK